MSVAAMSWAWEQPAAPLEKLVLLAIGDNADHENRSYMTAEAVNRKCGGDMTRTIAALLSRGLLTVETAPHPMTDEPCTCFTLWCEP